MKALSNGYRRYIMADNQWFETICKSYLNPPVFFNNLELPGFPPDELQARTTGQSGIATLKEAFIFYDDCINNFKGFNVPIQSTHKLLDFGVGWGRITRFFLKNLPITNIYGIDVMEGFVKICKETFRSDNFIVTAPFPPTPLLDAQFNFIIGYSVFSHLSEKACSKWMDEFQRILVPGGIVAVTTRGRHFFAYCESLKNKKNSLSDYQKSLIHSNIDGVGGGGAMNSSFYGESFIPKEYAQSAYSDKFTLEKFLFDSKRQSHPIMFFRKK